MTPYYEHGGIRIFVGDCREVLRTTDLRSDLLLTDPPYGVGWDRRSTWGSANAAPVTDYGKQEWDATAAPDDAIAAVMNACPKRIIWGGNYFKLPPSRGWLVWDKQNTGDFADAELAWTNLETAVRIFRFTWNGMIRQGEWRSKRVHPTQKPVELMGWCLSFAPEARSILDPFMGSGTTLRAAKDRGLRAVGIDTSEKYCEIAARRLEQEVLAL